LPDRANLEAIAVPDLKRIPAPVSHRRRQNWKVVIRSGTPRIHLTRQFQRFFAATSAGAILSRSGNVRRRIGATEIGSFFDAGEPGFAFLSWRNKVNRLKGDAQRSNIREQSPYSMNERDPAGRSTIFKKVYPSDETDVMCVLVECSSIRRFCLQSILSTNHYH